MTKDELGDLIYNRLLKDVESKTCKILEALWPEIEAAQKNKFKAGLDKAIEYMKAEEGACTFLIEDFENDDFYIRLENLKNA